MVTEVVNLQLIEEIKKLYVEDKQKQLHIKKMRENEFCLFCDKLQSIYKQEVENVYNKHIDPFLDEYFFLKEKSSLQIIDKLKYENYHSLFLEYLWGKEQNFGAEAFQDFINDALSNNDREPWGNTITQSSYKIIPNKPIKGQRKKELNRKRPDLIFVDKANKWCVIIENKIESKVSLSDRSNNRSQLDIYFDYGERKYKEFHYRLYILLSYTDNQEHRKGEWIYANYYQVFKSLLKFHTEDSRLCDYLQTLFALLFPNEQMDYYSSTRSLCQGMLFYNRVISKIKIK